MRVLLLVAALLGATLGGDVVDHAQLAGCTNDCDEVRDDGVNCPAGLSCTGTSLRHWLHVGEEDGECAVTACIGGQLQYNFGGKSDVLVCKEGVWYGKGKSEGEQPKATCSYTKSCRRCRQLLTTPLCPPGGECDWRLVAQDFHRDTGCAVYKCANPNAKLYALVGREWHQPDYVDCLNDAAWRLNSVRTMPAFPAMQLTCALSAADAHILRAFRGARIPEALKDPNVLEVIKDPKIFALLGQSKPADLINSLIDVDLDIGK